MQQSAEEQRALVEAVPTTSNMYTQSFPHIPHIPHDSGSKVCTHVYILNGVGVVEVHGRAAGGDGDGGHVW